MWILLLLNWGSGRRIRVMTLAHIRALAEEYATKYNPDKLAPFPYELVLQDREDLEIHFAALEDPEVSGLTSYENGKFQIIINTEKPAVRQNFTLGHELGHYFLHQDVLKLEGGIIDGDVALDGAKILYRMDDASSQRLEVEANNFAASLLMPADLVREAWRAIGSIQKLSRIFQVSAIAMSVRLTHLGLLE